MILAAFAAAMTVAAETETVGGYTWTFQISGGTAEIYNNGCCAASPMPTGALTIPATLGGKPVTSIGWNAFYGCSGLTSVTILDGVKIINSEAFCGCSGIVSISIPDSVTIVGDGAFRGCSGLRSISVGSGNPSYRSSNGLLLTKDGKTLIQGVNGDVVIPHGVTSIESCAFCGCSGLTSVKIPDSVTHIVYSAFWDCNESLFDTTTIPGVNLVDGWAVSHLDSLSGDLDLTVARGIGDNAFSGCYGLTSVTIGNGVKSIGDHAFLDCGNLVSITVGTGLVTVGRGAFEGCNIQDVHIADVAAWCQLRSSFSCGDDPFLSYWNLYIGDSLVTNLVIPEGVAELRPMSFYGCMSIESVSIPDGVCLMDDDWWGVFEECYSLKSVKIGRGVKGIKSNTFNVSDPSEREAEIFDTTTMPGVTLIDGYAVGCTASLSGALDLTGIRGIGCYAFSGCSGLTSVMIPDGIVNIERGSFYGCSGLTSVTIGRDVKSIEDYAFWGCDSLSSVVMPDGVKSIGVEAFRGCSALTSVTIPGSVGIIGAEAFLDCNESLFDVATITGVKLVDGWAVGYADALNGTQGTVHLNLSGVRGISESAFAGCQGISSLTIPECVTRIGVSTFSGCHALESVAISEGVIFIGDDAFFDCRKLSSITIPSTVTYIGGRAFASEYHRFDAIDGDKYDYIVSEGEVSLKATFAVGLHPLTVVAFYNKPCTAREVVLPVLPSEDTIKYVPVSGYQFYGWRDEYGNVVERPFHQRDAMTLYPDLRQAGSSAEEGGTSDGGDTPEATPAPALMLDTSKAGEVNTSFAKAQTPQGVLVDASGNVAGSAQVKVGKMNGKGQVKITATAVLMNGKKVTSKPITLNVGKGEKSGRLVFKGIGEMTFELADDGSFTLDNDGYAMAGVTVGGNLPDGTMTFSVDMDALPQVDAGYEILTDLLPTGANRGVAVSVTGGKKLNAGKAASPKYKKDRNTGTYALTGLDDPKKPNLSGLKLSYAPKTGLFKGSFYVYATNTGTTPAGKAPKVKKYKVDVTGFFVDDGSGITGEGKATMKKPAAGPWTVTVK